MDADARAGTDTRIRADARIGADPRVRADARFMRARLSRWIALGFGSGLSPRAPGTVGTLWAWLAFVVADAWLDPRHWALVLPVAFLIGIWACGRTARDLGVADHGAIVWDEIVAFWLVLVIVPGGWVQQLGAFLLFRFFDIVKPPPIRHYDEKLKNGFGVMFDDLLAALYTLFAIALFSAMAGPERWADPDARRKSMTDVSLADLEHEVVEAAVALGHALRARGWTIACAESCTGGLVCRALTEVGGSSDWFERGFVTYSNAAKTDLLGVSADTLKLHGAVSEPVAREMADGALARSRAQLALSITGIAGPGGAAPGKPVGTVCFGWAALDSESRTESVHFAGERGVVRALAGLHALRRARERLHELETLA